MRLRSIAGKVGGRFQLLENANISTLVMSNTRSYASIAGGHDGGKDGGAGSQKEKDEFHDDQSSKKHYSQNSPDSGNNTHKNQAKSNSDNKGNRNNHGNNSTTQRDRNTSPNNNNNKTASSGAYTASEYIRRPEHIPQTRSNATSPHRNGDTEQHYILTLLLSPNLHNYMTTLRKKYFPPHINKLDAHITLFHALPGSRLLQLESDISALCSRQTPFPITAEDPSSPRSNNIMVKATSPRFAIEGIQKSLRNKWETFLSDQDNKGIRPHWTVMNKVDDKAVVEKAMVEFTHEFERTEGTVDGLCLWRYDKGFWRDRRVWEFGKGEGGGR